MENRNVRPGDVFVSSFGQKYLVLTHPAPLSGHPHDSLAVFVFITDRFGSKIDYNFATTTERWTRQYASGAVIHQL